MARRLLEIAAAIAKAQASVGKITPEQIEQTLTQTFLVLQRMQNAEEQGIFIDGNGDMVAEAGNRRHHGGTLRFPCIQDIGHRGGHVVGVAGADWSVRHLARHGKHPGFAEGRLPDSRFAPACGAGSLTLVRPSRHSRPPSSGL